MSKKIIYTPKGPNPAGPYSQGVEASGFLFLSGQLPVDPKTGKLVLSDIKTQTKLVMENIRIILESRGCSFQDIVKTTIYTTDMAHFAQINEVYAEYFPKDPPARSTVGAAALPKGVSVEIDVIVLNRDNPHI